MDMESVLMAVWGREISIDGFLNGASGGCEEVAVY